MKPYIDKFKTLYTLKHKKSSSYDDNFVNSHSTKFSNPAYNSNVYINIYISGKYKKLMKMLILI
jgi:hypothetical protein